jgi:hypothetical protein
MIEPAERTLVCTGCGTPIEWCSFCDQESCASAVCHHCLIFEFGESAPHPQVQS